MNNSPFLGYMSGRPLSAAGFGYGMPQQQPVTTQGGYAPNLGAQQPQQSGAQTAMQMAALGGMGAEAIQDWRTPKGIDAVMPGKGLNAGGLDAGRLGGGIAQPGLGNLGMMEYMSSKLGWPGMGAALTAPKGAEGEAWWSNMQDRLGSKGFMGLGGAGGLPANAPLPGDVGGFAGAGGALGGIGGGMMPDAAGSMLGGMSAGDLLGAGGAGMGLVPLAMQSGEGWLGGLGGLMGFFGG